MSAENPQEALERLHHLFAELTEAALKSDAYTVAVDGRLTEIMLTELAGDAAFETGRAAAAGPDRGREMARAAYNDRPRAEQETLFLEADRPLRACVPAAAAQLALGWLALVHEPPDEEQAHLVVAFAVGARRLAEMTAVTS